MKVERKNIDFINAICASRTKKLVGKERLRRMAESENLSVAFDILRESAFGGDITVGYREYEKLIENEEFLLCEFVKEYAPSEELKWFCLIANDFYNAQAILKSEFVNLNYKDFVQAEGVFTIERLKTLIDNGNGEDFPKELVTAVSECKNLLKNGGGGMSVGALFTRAKFDCLKRITKQKYLKELLVNKIDGVNLSACLRAGDEEVANAQIISGGSLTNAQLTALIKKDKDAVLKLFKDHWLFTIALNGVESVLNGKPLVELEREINSVEAEKLIANRFTQNEGTFPFSLYYFKRKNEIACVRTILTGKANGLLSEQIKRRLITV